METEQFLKELNEFTIKMEQKTAEINKLIGRTPVDNKWIFSADVRQILSISDSTLKRMRKRNDVPYLKIGRTYYYPSIYFSETLLNKVKKAFITIFNDE